MRNLSYFPKSSASFVLNDEDAMYYIYFGHTASRNIDDKRGLTLDNADVTCPH